MRSAWLKDTLQMEILQTTAELSLSLNWGKFYEWKKRYKVSEINFFIYLFFSHISPHCLLYWVSGCTTNIYCLSRAETAVRNLPIKVEEHENFKWKLVRQEKKSKSFCFRLLCVWFFCRPPGHVLISFVTSFRPDIRAEEELKKEAKTWNFFALATFIACGQHGAYLTCIPYWHGRLSANVYCPWP